MKDRLKTTFGSRLAIAITAVILTATIVGGSVAIAQPFIGSRDIINNSVTSRDIRNNTVNTRDIRNGSIQPRDLSNNVFDALAAPLPIWVKVDAGNGNPSVASQSGFVDGVTRSGTGVYIVTFAIPITGCGWMATVNDRDAGVVNSYAIAIERASSGDDFRLLVRTFNSAGTPANLQGDDAFTLQVLC